MKLSFDRTSQLGSGGFLALKKLWDDLDLSLALSRAGIMKRSGASTWALVFALIAGWFAQKTSVLQTAKWVSTDDVVSKIVGRVSQSAFSRLLTRPFRWDLFNEERLRTLQDRPNCRLTSQDVLAVDDSMILHEHSRKIPFVSKLLDHATKRYVYAQNVVALYAARFQGPSYMINARFWKPGENQLNKWQMALQMLRELVAIAPHVGGCFVAMDSWYLVRPFLLAMEELGFRFVSKAKSNMVFYTLKPGKRATDRGAYERLSAKQVLRQLLGDSYHTIRKIASKKLYIKIEDESTGLAIYKQVQVVAVSGHRSQREETTTRNRAFLLVTGDLSASPEEVLSAYEARWGIETFFREVKQDLAFEACHSTNEHHVEAYLTLQMCAHTLLVLLAEIHNKTIAPEEKLTHGQVIRAFLGAITEIRELTNGEVLLQYTPKARYLERTLRILLPTTISLGWFQLIP